MEKIKTIGDCYMCAGFAENGITQASNARRMVNVADKMHHIINTLPLDGMRLAIRAGLHAGSVVSGIIGKTKFAFDIWGDAVNTASRMESTGVPGHTQITPEVYEMLPDKGRFVARGAVDVKGKGQMWTYVSMTSTQQQPPDAEEEDVAVRAVMPSVFNAVHILSDLMTEDVPLTELRAGKCRGCISRGEMLS